MDSPVHTLYLISYLIYILELKKYNNIKKIQI